jgi:NarL family two-component system response regulator LiaR
MRERDLTMTEVGAIRILVVDDHEVVRAGLKQFLANFADLECVGEAGSGSEAVALYRSLQPDVVLMDLFLPERNSGIEAIQQIVVINPAAAVIALTSSYETEVVRGALAAGATSYVLKTINANQLVEAIRATNQGRSMLAQEATQALIRSTRSTSISRDNLTERELAVLELLVDGYSNAEISERIHVAVPTVKTYVGSILSKLGAANRAEAVSLALRHQLVNLKI